MLALNINAAFWGIGQGKRLVEPPGRDFDLSTEHIIEPVIEVIWIFLSIWFVLLSIFLLLSCLMLFSGSQFFYLINVFHSLSFHSMVNTGKTYCPGNISKNFYISGVIDFAAFFRGLGCMFYGFKWPE